MSFKKNHYDTLGVDQNACHDDIKKAYKKLAIQYHPDKTGGNKEKEDKFKEIVYAYGILSDTSKRKQYDLLGDAFDENINIDDIFKEFNGFNDIFNNFFNDKEPHDVFSQVFTGLYNFKQANPDIIQNMKENFTNGFKIGMNTFTNNQSTQSFSSHTTKDGSVFMSFGVNMNNFDNDDIINILDNMTIKNNNISSILREHTIYVGIKEIYYGYYHIIKDNKYGKFRIKIPIGVYDGYTIKKNIKNTCSNKCDICNECNTTIKLKITVKYDLAKMEKFSLDKDNNLYLLEHISIIEYFCGFHREINFIDKKIIFICNKQLAWNENNEICIKDKGLPIYKKNNFTNLYIKFNIEFPKLEMFNKIKKIFMKILDIVPININNINYDTNNSIVINY